MGRVSTYLNFQGKTEEAFNFYRRTFGTEFQGQLMRFGEMAPPPGAPPMAEADRKKILHIELPILAGHVLMGTDMLESMGQTLKVGNNTTINLECDTRAEADKLYAALSDGSTEGSGMAPMFWGAYWGSCLDRFGIRWMFNAPLK
jgi:PhnB protein